MADSVTQKSSKSEDKTEPAQEEKQPPSRLSAKTFGKLLKWSIIILLALHSSLFGCCGVLCYGFSDPGAFTLLSLIWIFLGPVITSSIVVFLLNSVGDFYDDIQSWQIAYITWGALCTFIFAGITIVAHFEHSKKNFINLVRWLLYPFGIKPQKAEEETLFWTVPLVSVAPAMVIGYFANFIMAPKFVLACHESYGPIADPDSCFNDGAICCTAISSQADPLIFMAHLSSSILAAWGVVKIIGHFICLHDDNIVVAEDETEKTKKLVKNVLSSPSVRNIMKDSIALSEKEETENPKVKKEAEAGVKSTE